MSLSHIFSTPIFLKDYKKNTNFLLEHCYQLKNKINIGGKEWIAKPINSFDTYNLFNDLIFKELWSWVDNEVNFFAKEIGLVKQLKRQISWYNIYRKNDFQEFHNHNFNVISGIFFLKGESNDADVIFKNPMPENPHDPPCSQDNPFTWKTVRVPAKTNQLILFKSNLDHCVEAQPNENLRVSLSFNYEYI